ncbi:MAG: hypothetical protein QM652_07920 [Legionella sp.]|uniref:hypothetical protein n=1 Tax=Legionella sp. TaxID=459 RepID=UPI0039E694BA
MKNRSIDPEAKEQLRVIQEKILEIYNHGAVKALEQISKSNSAPTSTLVSFKELGIFSVLFGQYPDMSIPVRLIQPETGVLLDKIYNKIKYIGDLYACHRLSQLPISGPRNRMLKESVTLFSGPSVLAHIFSKKEPHLFKAMSFDGNKLFDNFHSHQSLPLGSSVEALQTKFHKLEYVTHHGCHMAVN